MKRILSLFYSLLISVLITSMAFGGGIPVHFFGPPMPPTDSSLVLNIDISRNQTIDLASRTAITQTYAGTNRTRINSAGLLEAVAANTPVIDHVGASLTPMLRLEAWAANALLEVITDWTKSALTTVTKDAVSWQGAVNGAWTIVAGGANATVVSTAIAQSSTANTFVCAMKRKTGTGAVYMTIDNGTTWTEKTLTTSYQYFNVTKIAANPQLGFKLATSGDEIIVDCLMLVPNTAIASSYFAPAAALGDELIATQADRDFSGASNWANVSINAYDETGDLTITASAAGQYCRIPALNAPMEYGKVYLISFDLANVAGASGWTLLDYAGNPIKYTINANATYKIYWVCNNVSGGGLRLGAANINSSGDFDNFSIKEAGSVRVSEENTLMLSMPASVAAALADTGTLVVDWIPGFSRAAGVVTNVVAFTAATASGLYTTTAAGNLSSYDGTTVAEQIGGYTANSPVRSSVRWPSSAGKFQVGTDIGAGSMFGTEANFDGAFTVGVNLILGYVLRGPTWYEKVKIFNKVLTDAGIDT